MTCEQLKTDKVVMWESIKIKVAQFAMKYSADKAEGKKEKSTLNLKLQSLIQDQCFGLTDNSDEQTQIQKQIEAIFETRVKASMFRAKVRWYDEGEKGTKYFLRLEEQRANNKTMTCLIKPDGSVSKKQKEILAMEAKFYKNLCTADPEIAFCFTNDTGIKLTDDQEVQLERPLELQELSFALNNMQNNKTPGEHGLNKEFVQTFWPTLRPILHQAFLQCFEQGILYRSARKGIISLIPKKSRDLL